MFGILLFAISVMYTPGPVNLLSLNSGAQKRFLTIIPFSLGVSSALALWFILFGWAGQSVAHETALPIMAGAGVCFILYLAYKTIASDIKVAGEKRESAILTYRDGFLMQLLNPKTMMVVVPVTTVQFPAARIDGGWIIIYSIGLAALGFGAPLVYAAFGAYISRRVQSRSYLKAMNVLMGIILIAVAVEMGYSDVYLAMRAP